MALFCRVFSKQKRSILVSTWWYKSRFLVQCACFISHSKAISTNWNNKTWQTRNMAESRNVTQSVFGAVYIYAYLMSLLIAQLWIVFGKKRRYILNDCVTMSPCTGARVWVCVRAVLNMFSHSLASENIIVLNNIIGKIYVISHWLIQSRTAFPSTESSFRLFRK